MAGLQTDELVLPGYAVAEHANDKYFHEKKLASHDHLESDAASHELDGIHDGLEFPHRRGADDPSPCPPTPSHGTLIVSFPPRKKDPSTVALTVYLFSPVIAFVELCERFSYYGSTVVFVSTTPCATDQM